jgi:CheY-like chemotaxis protein
VGHPLLLLEIAQPLPTRFRESVPGSAAIELTGSLQPDVVLLDLKLPRMDGLEVLRAVRTNSRTSMVPIVVLTASDDARELAQCYQLGANSCVEKPVVYQELRSALQGVGRYWLTLNQPPPPPALPRASAGRIRDRASGPRRTPA